MRKRSAVRFGGDEARSCVRVAPLLTAAAGGGTNGSDADLVDRVGGDAVTYTVVFVREEDGRYSVHVPALKGCHTWGENLPHAVLMAEEVITLFLESLRERGKPVPQDADTVTFSLGNATEAVVYRLAVKEGVLAA
jgi:antitoxin HicB